MRETLKEKCERLEAEIENLLADNGELTGEIEELKFENTRLAGELCTLEKEMAYMRYEDNTRKYGRE